MTKHLILGLLLLLPWPVAAQIIQPGIIPGILGCDYYAAPSTSGGSATNDGKYPSRPFRITDFWSVATPGTTLCLLSGEYRGDENMIDPTLGVNGTGDTANWPPGDGAIVSGSSPITIRALHDGGVLLNGEFARIPINLVDASWYVIQGVNARHGGSNLIRMQNSAANIIRRVVVWDAPITPNTGPILMFNNTGPHLIEDVGVFGTGRDMLHRQGGGAGTIFRRVWAKWEGSTVGNYKRVINLSYDIQPGTICENCLATWTAESQPHTWTATGGGQGIVVGQEYTNWQVWFPGWLIGFGNPSSTASDIDGRVYGSIAYIKSASSGQPSARGQDHPAWGLLKGRLSSDVRFEHSIAFIAPTHAKFTSILGLDYTTDASTTGIVYDHVTAVRNSDRIGSGVQITNSTQGTTLTINPWTNTGDGARVCFKYVNQQLTSEPLWPWLMNDRIIAATASAGRYTGPCQDCKNADGTPYTFPVRATINVTADMESLFGAIPVQCRR